MKNTIILLVAVISFSACNDDGLLNCERGSGEVVDEERSIQPFHSVEMRGSMNVQVTQDSTHTVVIEAQPNILRKIQTWVTNGRLIIDIDGCIRNHKDINVYVTMQDVETLALEGSGDFTTTTNIVADYLDLSINGSGDIDLPVEVEEVRSRINGSGNIRLLGNTILHDIEIDGSGDIFTFDMNSDITNIEIDGSGDCYIRANEELHVDINGSGDVHYLGFPSILTSRISGSGNIINEN